jgi:probable F420-dependent oxidoreductase
MREYLEAMAKARYLGPKPPSEPPVVIAALGPLMLDLARSAAHGAHTYFVPVEHTRMARERLGAGPVLAVELAFTLERDPQKARAVAREYAVPYARLPNYANNLKRLGWADADIQGPRGNDEQGQGGDGQPSDALLDALIAHGGPDDIAARVRAHLDAGADHVCVQPIGADRRTSPVPQLREMWPALQRI